MDPANAHFPESYFHETRGAGIVAANVCCQLLATFFVLARVYSRAWLLRSWRADDYALLVAWLLATAESITSYQSVHWGTGRHVEAVLAENPGNLIKIGQAGFVSQLIFIAVLPITKLSGCLTYRRILHGDRNFRISMDAIIAVLVLTAVPLMFVSIFQCRPISDFWEMKPDRNCLDVRPAFYVNGVSNILTDVGLIVLAFLWVNRLQMHPRQKFAVLAIVSLGWLAVVAGILRMVRTAPVLNSQADPLWDAYEFTIWTALEINVSIVTVSAVSIRPLISAILPRLLGTFSSRQNNSSEREPSRRMSRLNRHTLPPGTQQLKDVHGSREGLVELKSVP